MPVCTPLGQGLSAQLLVEEGNGKPPHHHPSSHFPSLDDTGVSPLSVITDLPYGRALIIISRSCFHNLISSCSSQPKTLWSALDSLLSRKAPPCLPTFTDPSKLASSFLNFFDDKITK